MHNPDLFKPMTHAEMMQYKNARLEYIGKVGTWTFYECPFEGDETPLLAMPETGEQILYRTCFWDMPHLEELT